LEDKEINWRIELKRIIGIIFVRIEVRYMWLGAGFSGGFCIAGVGPSAFTN
jgi:hypothetical protein